VIPPRESAAFVWRMEEVLDLYEEPYDPKRPVVCFARSVLANCSSTCASRYRRVRAGPGGAAVAAGRPRVREARHGQRARRLRALGGGTARRGDRAQRQARVRREQVRGVAEEDYPQAQKIRLVLDNLSTHTAAAF